MRYAGCWTIGDAYSQLKQILETLLKQYKQKETELQEFQREYAS